MLFAQVKLFPESASTLAESVDGLFYFLFAVTCFFTLLNLGLLIYFAVKYRRRQNNERSRNTSNSLALELTWTLIPLAIVFVIFIWGARVYFTWARPPEDSMEAFVVARQWMWKFQHLGGQREIDQLHVPVGRPVKLTMISQDVIHSFFVPEFRLHQDVLPGRYVTTWFQATKPGTYHLLCSQYCGTNHWQMVGEIIVMENDAFQNWLNLSADRSMATRGRQLFLKLQCVSCHSADAKARAPVLENLFGTQVPLDSGSSVRADEAYIRESILIPDAKVVAGFKPIMPTFKGLVNEEEMQDLVAFIKSLGTGQTPRRVEEAEPPEMRPLPKEGKQ